MCYVDREDVFLRLLERLVHALEDQVGEQQRANSLSEKVLENQERSLKMQDQMRDSSHRLELKLEDFE